MKITVSGKQKDVKDALTISELIELEKVETPEYVTVSVNEEFIKKEDYETHALQGGDSVEFLYFMGGGSGADYTVADTVDITDVICPVTFVKAKVALEELEIGEVLRVHMNGGEPTENVPRSFKDEGQEVLDLIDNNDGTYDLIVKKLEE